MKASKAPPLIMPLPPTTTTTTTTASALTGAPDEPRVTVMYLTVEDGVKKIESPNYPADYPSNLDKIWVIKAKNGQN